MPIRPARLALASWLCLAIATISATRATASVDSIRLEEIGFSCIGGATAFIEIAPTAGGQTFEPGLFLGITNSIGDSTSVQLNFGAATGSPWLEGTSWLLAGSQFTLNTGVARDGPLGSLDVTGGSLTLFTFGPDDEPRIIDRFVWGNAPGLPRAPYRRQSLQRVGSGFTVQSHPTPTPSSGPPPGGVNCYGYEPHTSWRIDEALFGCESAIKGVRFVELLCTASGRTDPNLRLNIMRADGGRISQVALFGSTAGQSVAAGERVLGATALFQSSVGLMADFALPVAFDSTGGVLELVLPNAAGDSTTVIDRVEYGSFISQPRPRPGYSLHRQVGGGLLEGLPTPVNRAGIGAGLTACFASVTVGHAWRIEEFGLGCRVASTESWFIEIRSLLNAQPGVEELGLRVRDRDGAVIADVPSLLGSAVREFNEGQRFLIGPAGFEVAAGLQPDRLFATTPDGVGGSLELYLSDPTRPDTVIHALRYGSVAGSFGPAPALGSSLEAIGADSFGLRAVAAPMNSVQAVATTECFSGQTRDGLRIGELGVSCGDGRPGVWFVELVCLSPETFIDDRMRLTWYSRTGALITTLPALLANRSGQRLLSGNRLLVGPSTLASLGAIPDQARIATPDSIAGRVVFSRLRPDGSDAVLSEIRYGDPTPLPFGASLVRAEDSTNVLEPQPTPQNSVGSVATQGGCFGMRTRGPIALRQMATRCLSGAPASFVEVLIEESQRIPPNLGLIVQGASGSELGDVPLFPGFEGRFLVAGSRFLVASAGFDRSGGLARDGELPFELDPVGGSLVLYERIGTPPVRSTIHRLSYGGSASPAPGPGSSLVRTTGETFVLDHRPRPRNLLGATSGAPCWSPTDSTVRIAEIGLACFLGAFDVSFVEVQSLDPLAVLDSALWIRILDGNGITLASRPLVSSALHDRPWGANARLLAANAGFAAAASFSPDVVLSRSPASDSGEVHLLWRAAGESSETLIDSWRYGGSMGSPLPLPGGALVRLASGVRTTSRSSTPERLNGQIASGPCFAYQRPYSIVLQQLGLRCSDGSVSTQYAEIRALGALRLDPGVGVQFFDGAGVSLGDEPRIFADRAWQYSPANTSFLFGTPSSEANALPDRPLPAVLDTSAGSVLVYHEDPEEGRVALGRWFYGQIGSSVIRPAPGLALERDGAGKLVMARAMPRRFHGIAWSVPLCHESIAPAVQITEMSLGCAYEPLDGRGRFVELRNSGATALPLNAFELELGRNETLEWVPIDALAGGGVIPGGGTWLIASPAFEGTIGLRPDATSLRYVPERSWRARLFWTQHARYSPMVVDRMAIALALDGRLYPEVPYGSSLERVDGDSLRTRALPGPRASNGDSLMQVNSCLGASAPSAPVSIAQFSPGCFGCGPESAFLELTYPQGTGTDQVRIRTQDRDGAVLSEIESPWGTPGSPAPGPGPSSGAPYRWLVGAPGFRDSMLYAPQIELPFTLDAGGGTITLYEPGTPERIHVQLPFGPIAPSAGVQREARSQLGRWPRPYAPVERIFPENRTLDYSLSGYGEELAYYVRPAVAGASCADGDPTLRYVMLSALTHSTCHHSYCYIDTEPPRAGRVRTLDVSGAALDSAEFGPHLTGPSPPPAGGSWGYTGSLYPLFASGAMLTSLGIDPIQVAPRLDDRGGTVQFVMLDRAGRALRTLSSVDYVAPGTDPTRPKAFFDSGWPPFLHLPLGTPAPTCPPCASHSRRLAGQSPSTAVHLDTTVVLPSGASRRVYVDGPTGRMGVHMRSRDGARFAEYSTTRFQWVGGAEGAPARIRARLALQGSVRFRRSATGFDQSHFQLTAIADADHGLGVERAWWSPAGRETTYAVTDTLDLAIPVRGEEPFRLTLRWSTAQYHDVEDLELDTQWLFDQLPEGTRVTSCHGFGGGSVPTALANVSAEVHADRVELLWAGADPGERVRIQRTLAAGEGHDVAALDADGEGRIRYRDDDILAGQRLAYRLRRADGTTTAAVEVTVPLEVRLALRLVGEQPARGAIAFDITRVPGRDARLELFDVAGRRVASAFVGAAGAATQRVTLERSPVPPGLYLARLSCGRECAESRLVVAP